MNHDHPSDQPRSNSRGKIVLAVFLAVAAFFLLTEHRAHLFGFLPYLLLLACPLMHFFHHGGHGGHQHGGHGAGRNDTAPRDERTKED
jgi:hypothetical protein